MGPYISLTIKKNFSIFWGVIIGLLVSLGCSFDFDKREFERGKQLESNHQFKLALDSYTKVFGRSSDEHLRLEATKRAAQIAFYELKNYLGAADFYRKIVIRASRYEDRVAAQRKLAAIYFFNLNDYSQAIAEYGKLLTVDHNPSTRHLANLNIAKSYFRMGHFFQAMVEVDSLLKGGSDLQLFEVTLLKGNIYFATRKIEEAIEIYNELMRKFPQRAVSENVALNLVVCYEELKNFDQAIAVLNEIKPSYSTPEFIDLRIKSLVRRQALLPGATGLKK